MIRWDKIRLLPFRTQMLFTIRNNATTSEINIEKLEKDSLVTDNLLTEDPEVQKREVDIEKSRNKSRLSDNDRKLLHEINPYPEPYLWHHGTVKYVRRTYGRYGEASGVNPALCWPLKEELDDQKEFERVAHPYTILEMIEKAKRDKQEKNDRIMLRQKNIVEKMTKLEQWKRDLHNRVKKKEDEMKAAKESKERLIEEVRRHFGNAVDVKDEKFQELLAKKEKEQRKVIKEAKRKARAEKIAAYELKDPIKGKEIQEGDKD